MSADSHSNCPACPAQFKAELEACKAEMDQAYGRVSRDEYERISKRVAELRNKIKYTKRDAYSLAEYFEIYYKEDKQAMIVDYSAECRDCGWQLSFRHEHKVELPK